MSGDPVDFYFDPVSPYSYLATTQIETLVTRHGRRVNWHPVLVGVTVIKVMGLKPVPLTPLKSDYSRLDLARQAEIFGVPLNRHGLKGVSSVAACRAFLWLNDRDAPMAKALITRLSARLWVEGVDPSAPETVVAEARALGADGDALWAALQDPGVKQRLDLAVDSAIARGVFGVPFFIVDGQPLWGCDRMWMLDYRLAHGHWPKPDTLPWNAPPDPA
ncbi:2-hydroxychromene-2-carboxylate isomerase [Pararhodobacter marinus]|uniref:2-hydroxychromene-2-carboxylate isomerase n=2 Tax=Pararhodobacter marinus TaxID=2184063 RepID=UPI003514AB2F